MNHSIKILFLFILGMPVASISQSLSPQVIASSGGYQSAGGISLSYTIGETNTQTLNSAGNMLTQGFQQPFELRLDLKLFLEGFYSGAGQMKDVLYNQGVYANPSLITDSIIVELHQSTMPYTTLFQQKTLLKQNGEAQVRGIGLTGQSYYIVIRHRNIIETWSANPVFLNTITQYDFSDAAGKAYGNNQISFGSGIWAFYSGDLNSDENIDLLDMSMLEASVNNFEFGYFATDINGDGNVDLLDVPIVESNLNQFIYTMKP